MMQRILVVDDEPAIADFCSRILQREGYDTRVASSGEAALALIESEWFDLLLTDIVLPGITGVDLLLEARRRMPDIAAVIMTGHGSIELAVRALRAGAHDFMLKPFTVTDLSEAMEHALSRVRLVEENHRLNALLPLLSISKLALESPDADALLGRAADMARAEGRAAGVAIFLADETGRLRLRAVSGALHIDVLGAPDLLRAAMESEGARVVTRHDAASVETRAAIESAGIAAVLLVPMRVPSGAVGALLLAKTEGQPPVTAGDAELMTVLGSQVAALLENTRLVNRLEAWNHELEQRLEDYARDLAEAQERLIQQERLAVIGKLGAGVAHELRNPLGVIGNSAYYLTALLGRADAKVARHLDIIREEVQVSNGIISDLMGFVKGRDIQAAPVDPNAVVRATIERALLPASIALRLDLAEGLSMVAMDQDRMEQVFLNLINNAVQAMPDGGALTIATRIHDGHVRFSFADTGGGIRPEDRERIFEPLFTTRAKGFGLGLSIAQQHVKAHGGEIVVTSVPDAGACFIVSLPLAPAGRRTSVPDGRHA